MFTELRFQRYRCFRDEQRIALRRLSLVYGENNAGKSAIVRLLPWLAASRDPDQPGLNLDAAPLRQAGWFDLPWRGALPTSEDRALTLGLTLDATVSWTWGAAWSDAWREPVLERIGVERDGRAVELTWQLTRGEQHNAARSYHTPAGVRPVKLDGVIPEPVPEVFDADEVASLRAHLVRVAWLAARRQGPSRDGVARGRKGTLEGDGAGAEAIALTEPELRARVSTWYQGAAGAELLSVSGREKDSLVLRPLTASFDVAFPDLGEGLQQCFPVLVGLEQLRERGGLLVIEEPESHLHPRLQQRLAARMVDVLTARPDAQLLLETHSEVLLLAALEAAADRLRGDVSLSWVSSTDGGACLAQDVRLDATGRPETDLLERAFDTMGVLRRRVIEVRRAAHAR
jgi:hypothetical protein